MDGSRNKRRAKPRKAAQLNYATPAAAPSRRRFFVFVSLTGLLTFTSVLLMALSPAPLTPGAPASLFALDVPQSMDAIFTSASPVQPGRWKYVFVHHSRTSAGSASDLTGKGTGPADHFVIGNGDGAIDGEIQLTQRWAGQLPAAPANGLDKIGPDCISICLIGDFDSARPTPTQTLRLTQLVSALQRKLEIAPTNVIFLPNNGTSAGVGKLFPAETFRTQLLP